MQKSTGKYRAEELIYNYIGPEPSFSSAKHAKHTGIIKRNATKTRGVENVYNHTSQEIENNQET